MLLWLANVFAQDGYWLTPFLFFCLFSLTVLWRQRFLASVTDAIILHLPGLGLFFHNMARAHVCRGIGTLLKSGVPIQEALKIQAQAMENYYYRQSLLLMVDQIALGEGFGKVLARYPTLYPILIQRMVSVGEHSGELDQLLFFLARFYEEDISLRAKNLSSVIEPLLLLVIGLGVAFVALSIFTPIYSITSDLGL